MLLGAQVILKPDPGNPQELYLGSLAALGINTRAHDVRFVEDNWESPVLGAWGLGWEVSTAQRSAAQQGGKRRAVGCPAAGGRRRGLALGLRATSGAPGGGGAQLVPGRQAVLLRPRVVLTLRPAAARQGTCPPAPWQGARTPTHLPWPHPLPPRGWQVWLDGMEVTQFTYFQQAGGKPLGVPAVEITYGLERILMSLQVRLRMGWGVD